MLVTGATALISYIFAIRIYISYQHDLVLLKLIPRKTMYFQVKPKMLRVGMIKLELVRLDGSCEWYICLTFKCPGDLRPNSRGVFAKLQTGKYLPRCIPLQTLKTQLTPRLKHCYLKYWSRSLGNPLDKYRYISKINICSIKRTPHDIQSWKCEWRKTFMKKYDTPNLKHSWYEVT